MQVWRSAAEIRRTWRDVRPCRVRLNSLADRANFQLFLTGDEQLADFQVRKNVLRGCRVNWGMGKIRGSGCRFGPVLRKLF